MFYYSTGRTDAPYNLAYEQYLFDRLPAGASALGLWQNRCAVIVGKHQNTNEEIDPDYVRAHGIEVVRRITGGGAVYHDLGNLNYTYITDAPEGQSFDFEVFTRPVIAALGELGVQAELSGRNDLCIDGQKFSGNAQHIRGTRVLHHGTLLFDADLETIRQVLRVRPEKLYNKGVTSVRSRVTNIAQHLPESMALDAFQSHLLRHLRQSVELVPFIPTASDLEAIESLRASRYATWDWNWGASPQYNARRYGRFEGGSIAAYLQIEGNRLQSVALCGDYFAVDDAAGLTAALTGIPLTCDALHAALSPLGDLSNYIFKLDADTLVSLLLEESCDP